MHEHGHDEEDEHRGAEARETVEERVPLRGAPERHLEDEVEDAGDDAPPTVFVLRRLTVLEQGQHHVAQNSVRWTGFNDYFGQV